MLTATTAGLILLAFVAGAVIGRFERADRRIDHEPASDLTPSLYQLRSWRKDRR